MLFPIWFQESKAKLVIGTVYILLGMAILAMCFNLMQEKIVVQEHNSQNFIFFLIH